MLPFYLFGYLAILGGRFGSGSNMLFGSGFEGDLDPGFNYDTYPELEVELVGTGIRIIVFVIMKYYFFFFF